MKALLRWAINAAALYATVWLLTALGLATSGAGPWYGWLLAALVMGLVNALIRPLARLLTAPLNCLTFGILGILVNGLMFWLVPVIMEGLGMPIFQVKLLGAVVGSILVSLVSGFLSNILFRDGEDRHDRRDRYDRDARENRR